MPFIIIIFFFFWCSHWSDYIWKGSSDLWVFLPLLFRVPAGRFVLSGRGFSQSWDTAPSLHVSVEWFNFLTRPKAVGFSSLHYFSSLYNYHSQNLRVTWRSPVKEKRWNEDQWLLIYYCMWKRKKKFRYQTSVNGPTLCIWSLCTLSTLGPLGNIGPFRAQSHLDIIPSAPCPFPQSWFCIIPLRKWAFEVF